MKKLKVLLLGDDCLDVYKYGTVNRISPEAPVPIFDFNHTISKPGMSSNVFENLVKLGCDVAHITGDMKSVKTRYIDIRTQHQLLRVDEDNISKPIEVGDFLNVYIPDCIVISDYNKGALTYDNIKKIINLFEVPIFIDTKKTDLSEFDRIWPSRDLYLKINELEESRATTKSRKTIVTLGKDGARYNDITYPAPHVEVSDVCGAGDTFLSALAYHYTHNKHMPEAIKFAIKASTITVQHLGVYAPSLEEIQ